MFEVESIPAISLSGDYLPYSHEGIADSFDFEV